eukprot:jgi/Picsp_1/1398/NSC_04877-R1_ubiquitin fusion degradation protein
MFGIFGGIPGNGSFEAHYRCYPVSFIEKQEAERGDKIFLPPSALNRLAQLHIEYPMLFKAENRRGDKSTHCGVLEFVADEGFAYLPYWMMENLDLEEGQVVTLRSISLPKGSFVKLQPHSKDFLDITNPRAVLETALRGFSCLTVGDTIPIYYNDKTYWINIIEAKPADAISVIETDCNVDFAPPLDYVEPEPVLPPSVSQGSVETESQKEEDTEAKPDEISFLAFAGTGRRLDGKPASESKPVAIPMAGGPSSRTSSFSNKEESTKQTQSGSAPKKSGKLMFKDRLAAKFRDPASAKPEKKPEDKPIEKEENGEDKSSFKPFQGTSFKLK